MFTQVLALLINLKRGPWAGVTILAFIYFMYFKKKIAIPFILAVGVLFFSVSPIRERIFQSSSHFFISGGRNVIWDIGFELASTYPLGIGLQNSSFLRNFSDEIPPQLKHFHSNFINILVETGWFSFGIYLLWFYIFIQVLFISSAKERNIPVFLLSCAILSSQFAGLVEYNMGDKEILLTLFYIMGIACAMKKNSVTAGILNVSRGLKIK